MTDLDDCPRHELLELLGKWNERLRRLGANPQITVEEAAQLRRLDQLRQVVDATADRLVDVIVATARH